MNNEQLSCCGGDVLGNRQLCDREDQPGRLQQQEQPQHGGNPGNKSKTQRKRASYSCAVL